MRKIRIFRSIEEIKKEYFPENYRQEIISKLNSQELGKYFAEETMNKIRKMILKNVISEKELMSVIKK